MEGKEKNAQETQKISQDLELRGTTNLGLTNGVQTSWTGLTSCLRTGWHLGVGWLAG